MRYSGSSPITAAGGTARHYHNRQENTQAFQHSLLPNRVFWYPLSGKDRTTKPLHLVSKVSNGLDYCLKPDLLQPFRARSIRTISRSNRRPPARLLPCDLLSRAYAPKHDEMPRDDDQLWQTG